MTQLCESFRREAGRVWNQMNEARGLHLSLSEETITETCLFNIAKRHHTGDIAVIPATKPQEAKHGADWEWWFARKGRGVGFRVQAKRLFKPNNPFAQLQKLVTKAVTDGLQPLYCFYNYDAPPGGFDGYTNNCHHDYHGPSFWGCTIALPQDVQFIGKDTIADLRTALDPWHSLVCPNPSKDLLGSVLAQIERMARARRLGSRRRDLVETVRSPRELPQHVQRIVELGRTASRPEDARYLDSEIWNEEMKTERDVAGIVVVHQRE